MQKWFVNVAGVVTLLSAHASAQTAVYPPGNGVKAPRLIQKVKPVYPAAAERDHRQGKVLLTCVVNADGVVSEVAVTEASGDEFSDAAVAAAWQYRFKPGLKNGQAVAVRIPLEMVFTLH
jgi:periplasmic protein TonB